MVMVYRAPMMRIRRHQNETVRQSFTTTATIPATLAALREYMGRHTQVKLSGTELMSVRFRHRNSQQLVTDQSDVTEMLRWPGHWQIKYVRDVDLEDAKQAAVKLGGKVKPALTIFGYCEALPVG